MKRQDYMNLIKGMNDSGFNAEISSLAVKLDLGINIPGWKLEALRVESERRGLKFDTLLAESSYSPGYSDFVNPSFKSLDQLDDDEITELKNQLRKRQRNKIDSDRLDTSTLPLFFNIESKNMIIAPVHGDSMTGFGLREGDLAVIDSSVTPKAGEIILVRVEDRVFIKKIEIEKGFVTLHSGNDKYEKVKIVPGRDYEILGVMRYHIKSTDN